MAGRRALPAGQKDPLASVADVADADRSAIAQKKRAGERRKERPPKEEFEMPRLAEADLSAENPEQLILHQPNQVDVVLAKGTKLSAHIDGKGIRFAVSPEIFVDVPGPTNAHFRGLYWSFETASLDTDFS